MSNFYTFENCQILLLKIVSKDFFCLHLILISCRKILLGISQPSTDLQKRQNSGMCNVRTVCREGGYGGHWVKILSKPDMTGK